MNFLNNQLEKQTGMDMNGDGIISRLPDTIPGGGAFPPMYFDNNYDGFPPSGYGDPGPY